eukprot:4999498-Pleurochrysis_carterae.AAC.2
MPRHAASNASCCRIKAQKARLLTSLQAHPPSQHGRWRGRKTPPQVALARALRRPAQLPAQFRRARGPYRGISVDPE